MKKALSCLIALFFPLFLLSPCSTSFALSPENHLSDDAQEQRAMKLFLEVRCLVCEGQVIESSNTDFSFEMRKLIRQKIADGKSDQEIRDELIAEFGEDILVSSSFGGNHTLLWLLPIGFALYAFNEIRLLKKTSESSKG